MFEIPPNVLNDILTVTNEQAEEVNEAMLHFQQEVSEGVVTNKTDLMLSFPPAVWIRMFQYMHMQGMMQGVLRGPEEGIDDN